MTHNGKEIRIQYLPFPVKTCGGAAIQRKDDYLVAINTEICPLNQRKALGHELGHVFLNHLEQPGRPVKELEDEADRYAWPFYRAFRDGKLPEAVGTILAGAAV